MREGGDDMPQIKGQQIGDYFKLVCDECGENTRNEYIGWDPVIPCFRATCLKCGTSTILKLSVIEWKGLSPNPFNPKRSLGKLHKNWGKRFKPKLRKEVKPGKSKQSKKRR